MCGLAASTGLSERARRHERIVFSRDDQRGHRDAVDDPHRAALVVVVLGILEAEVRRREDVVEFPHGLDRLEPGQIEQPWPVAFLAHHPLLELAHEIPLVEDVLAPLERARALADLDDRRYRGDADERVGRIVAVFACEFQGEVSAE